MHGDHDLVYHLFAQWFAKSDYAADCPEQNDAGDNQRKLLNVIGDVCGLLLFFHNKYPIHCWYGHVDQAENNVDRVKEAVVNVFKHILWDQFKSVWESQVTEGKNPVSQVEGYVCGKAACTKDLARKIGFFYISVVLSDAVSIQ